MADYISVIKFLRNALDNFFYYVPVIQCIINKGLVQSLKRITLFLSELFICDLKPQLALFRKNGQIKNFN